MKKNLKNILKMLLLIIMIVLILQFGIFIHHKVKSRQELAYLKKYDTGKIITINGQKINYKIFNETNNEHTILLMGGSGVTDLSLSFEPLSQKINAKIILINRPGYGFSDDSNKKATVDYIVDFYRKALKELNINEKIILMPHSLSGMYAMYWSEMFSNEIERIIGLDIGSPYMYQNDSNNYFFNYISYLGSKLGIHRLIYKMGEANTAIKNYNIYSNDYFKAIWYMNMKNPYSKFNLSEESLIKENANTVIKNMNTNYHNIQKLYIIANYISGNYYEQFEKKNLENYYKNKEDIEKYIMNVIDYQKKEEKTLQMDSNTSIVSVEGPHLLYYYPTEQLANLINDFLEK